MNRCPTVSNSWGRHGLTVRSSSSPSLTSRPLITARARPVRRRSGVDQFVHRAIGLVDRRVGVSGRGGIGIGNGDSAEAAPSDLVWRFTRRPFRIEQGVVLVAVAVRPAVYRYRFDVAGRIEASAHQNARKLIANLALAS